MCHVPTQDYRLSTTFAVEHGVLPDATNLTLVSTENTSFTVSWERPKDDFDYYLVDVTDSSDDDAEPYRVGSCANGSIVDAHQTQVTCDYIEPCTNVTFRIRTYVKGPPERVSMGVTLDGIIVRGQGPGSPSGVFIARSSPSLSQLRWSEPGDIYGTIQGYRLRICQRYKSCEVGQEMAGCEEYASSINQYHWETTQGTPYCVLVSARARCGDQVITGRPVATEVTAFFAAFPRVNNLALVSAKNRSFTVSWGPPMDKFDYYRVQVVGSGNVTKAGSCADGTVIDAKDTSLTCDDVKDCKNLTFKIRMYNRGPPERGYHPAVLKGIFIPGQVPESPNNVTIVGISASRSRLQWEPPENISGTLRDYTVRICHRKGPCDAEPDLTGCVEHRTSNNWFDFDTTEGAPYCVQVKANTLCGDQIINGRPATAEVMTPSLQEKAEK